MRNLVLLLILVGLLAGCSMAPTYTRPDSPVESRWPDYVPATADEGGADAAEATANMGWETFFTDANLRRLIALALEHNRDMRIAVLNIEKARGAYQIQRAEQLPGVTAQGTQLTRDNFDFLPASGRHRYTHEAGLSVGITSFELDLFGRIQSLKDEALERYLATEEACRSARISLVALVAQAYLGLVADRERLQISQETLRSQTDSYAMIKRRHEMGVSSELDLRQAQTSVERARVSCGLYAGRVAEARAALYYLVGTRVDADMLPAGKLAALPPFQLLPVGMPSQVLLQRPDILMAEHQLKAANANIGAARANFFPRIALTTSIGTGADELFNLFNMGTGAWMFAPQISLPLFSGGRNLATLAVSETEKKIAVANYEQAIQAAFREVSTGLALRDSWEKQLVAQGDLTRACEEAYRLSTARYTQGIDSYLNVLVSQRELFNAQLSLVDVRQGRDANSIELYKALGGGWKR